MLAVAAQHCPRIQFKLLPYPAVFSRNAAQRSLHCPPSPLSFFSTLLLDRVKLIPFYRCMLPDFKLRCTTSSVHFGAYGMVYLLKTTPSACWYRTLPFPSAVSLRSYSAPRFYYQEPARMSAHRCLNQSFSPPDTSGKSRILLFSLFMSTTHPDSPYHSFPENVT